MLPEPGDRYAELEVFGGGRSGGRDVNWKLSFDLRFGFLALSLVVLLDVEGDSMIEWP